MSRVIVITGPTAVGKTKLSIELAKKLNGEIINADAMQVYKGLNIGTAKVTEKEKENIPHHLFDIKEVEEEYSIYNYQKDCRNKIKEILSKNKIVCLVLPPNAKPTYAITSNLSSIARSFTSFRHKLESCNLLDGILSA